MSMCFLTSTYGCWQRLFLPGVWWQEQLKHPSSHHLLKVLLWSRTDRDILLRSATIFPQRMKCTVLTSFAVPFNKHFYKSSPCSMLGKPTA